MTFYHVSDVNHDKKLFHPRVPPKNVRMDGENGTVKRICVSPTIAQCIRAIEAGSGVYYVHVPDGKFNVVKPTSADVPDQASTNEHWIITPVQMKCVGIIRVNWHYFSPSRWKWIERFE